MPPAGPAPPPPPSWSRFAAIVQRRYETLRAASTAGGIRRLLAAIGKLEGVESPADLTDDLVVRFIQARRAKPVCENTIIGELGRLKAVCTYAVDKRFLAESPFRKGECLLRPSPPKRLSHISQRSVGILLAKLEAEIAEAIARDDARTTRPAILNPRSTFEWRARRIRSLIATYAFTGARRNEILYMWLEDIDLARRIMEIKPERHDLKTRGSARKVPIFPELGEILEDWIPRTGSHLLFPGSQNKGPWTGGSPGYRPLDVVKAACARAGIPGAYIHIFRHTFVTHAEQWGIPAQGAMRITGMTQQKTLSYYSHSDDANLLSYVPDEAYPRLAKSGG